MRWPHFLLMKALGGVCWAAVFGFGAYLLGERIKLAAGPAGVLAIAAAVILVVAGFVFFRRYEKKLEAQPEAAIPRLHEQGPRAARGP